MKFFSLFLTLFSLTCVSQNTLKYDRKYSDTLPQRFILDKDMLREHIFKGVPEKIKNGEYGRRAFNFAHFSACDISDYIADGDIYSDWDALEAYLNNILKKIIPDELKSDSVIHAFIVRDGNFNAFMTPSGHAFIHTGLLAEMPDEATLAGIMCHELAHYYLRHSLLQFLEQEAGNFNTGLFTFGSIRNKFSVKNELQADSLAAVWLHKSGYSINGLVSSFQLMNRMDKNRIKKLKDDWVLKEQTHPLSQKRLDQINSFVAKYRDNDGKTFLVDQNYFFQMKEEVKPEVLKALLDEFYYNECIEKSFRFHLFDPDNLDYIYYLMEAIRREAYLDVNIWTENFITNKYYDSVSVNGVKHKEKMKDHLFKKFDLTIIPIDPAEGMKLKAKFYWKETPRFTTYEEAYNFFYKLGEAVGCSECVLSNALSFTKEKDTRNELLKKYLQQPNIKHKEYAENLLNGTIKKSLENKKIVAVFDLETAIDQSYERIPLPDKKFVYKAIVDSAIALQKNRTMLFLPEFKIYNINDYRRFKAMRFFSFISIISKGEATELHILNPDYWEMFNKYKTNETEFLMCRYYELRGKDKTIDGYKTIINTDYEKILGKTTYPKTVEIFISSLRSIDNAAMKIRYASGEIKLSDKETTKNQLLKQFQIEFNTKDKKAAERDNLYRINNGGKK